MSAVQQSDQGCKGDAGGGGAIKTINPNQAASVCSGQGSHGAPE